MYILLFGLIKKKRLKIHRVVCEMFIPNPDNKPCINHKDGNKYNNHVSNLEWVTYQENTVHAFKTGLRVGAKTWLGKFGSNHHSAKGVIQLLNGQVIKEWPSVIEAANELNIQKSGIAMACRKDIKRYKGYDWQYN